MGKILRFKTIEEFNTVKNLHNIIMEIFEKSEKLKYLEDRNFESYEIGTQSQDYSAQIVGGQEPGHSVNFVVVIHY